VTATPATRAVMTVDVEDWFHVENLRTVVRRETWDERELRVERSVERVLELMADARARGTFFVLGWVAERCPALVRRIAAEGHEVASHGFGHELLPSLTTEQLRADLGRSKQVLEELVGASVRGYRAPSFSITDGALPVLQEAGFAYDSSYVPTIGHDRYGRLHGVVGGEAVTEVAPSCLMVGRRGLPWGGGGYFRLLPYALFRRGVDRIRATGRPYVFYIHPWELDAGQPRVDGLPKVDRFRHYVGLERCEARLRRLLRDLRWSTIADLLADVDASRTPRAA
jgi:polysaccharide deacetylase family protein (PEP-CTERM system associated)